MALASSVAALIAHIHAVGHVEIGLLAHRLHLADDLADIALRNQLRRQVRVQHNRHALIFLRDEARFLHRRSQHIVLAQRDQSAVNVKRHGFAALERIDDIVAVHRLQVLANLAQQLAVLRAKGAHLGLELIGW